MPMNLSPLKEMSGVCDVIEFPSPTLPLVLSLAAYTYILCPYHVAINVPSSQGLRVLISFIIQNERKTRFRSNVMFAIASHARENS